MAQDTVETLADYIGRHTVPGVPDVTVGRVSFSDLIHLAPAFCKFQAELAPALKSADNPFFRSKYADISSCLNTVRKPLANNGLSITQHPGKDGEEITLTTILLHSSGEWMVSENRMTPEKKGPQADGSCLTYLRRYSLAAITGLAQADDDGNSTQTQEDVTPSATIVGFGKYEGETLGWIAQTDLGYLKYMAQSSKSEFKALAQTVLEAHQEPLTDDQVSDGIQDADSHPALASLWRLLDDAQKIEYKAAFKDARAILKAAQPKRNAENARS